MGKIVDTESIAKIRKWLVAEGGEDPLTLASATILDLSSSQSWGFVRAIPYAKVREPKPRPPMIDDPGDVRAARREDAK